MSSASPKTVRYQVEHVTRYEYGAKVMHAHHLLHLTPRDHAAQRTRSHHIEVTPLGRCVMDTDSFGNAIQRIELDRPHAELIIAAHSELEVTERPALDAQTSLPWERVRDELSYCSRPRTSAELEVIACRLESPHVRIKHLFGDFSASCFERTQPVLKCAELLMHKIHDELTYAPGTTQVNTSLLAVLESRRGVCQDFSHLMIACLRAHGLSARYVSGYLRTMPAEGAVQLVGADASHAWVSVYAPPFGWVDLDPTNGVYANTDHLTLGWGRDFNDVSPVRGVIVGGGHHLVSVAVTVTPQSLNASDQV